MTHNSFWKGRHVLVTGHTGFVGAWLTVTLAELGAEVTGFSLPAEDSSLYSKVEPSLRIQSIEGDIRNPHTMQRALEESNPEIVFHLAAFGFVRECFSDPQRAFTTNVDGTLCLLEAIRRSADVRVLVAASSDKVYLNSDKEKARFSEDAPLGGLDPYSASKTCEDILIQSFFNSYWREGGPSCTILRPSNILGGGDHLISRLIPGMFHSFRLGETPEIRNPNSIRPWQNVMDMIDAYLCAAESASGTGLRIYNVGPEESGLWTVGEIAAFVSGLYGKPYAVSKDRSEKAAPENRYLGLNTEKIRREIGWRPIRKLDDTLREIYEFYMADDGYNTASLCVKQIRNFFLERDGMYGTLER